MAKFDLMDALKEKGFTEDWKMLEGGWTQVTMDKDYNRDDRVNEYGILNADFSVRVRIKFDPYYGEPKSVRAYYSNGKVKDHCYDKRAYNAIRDTVKYNGFDL